MANKKLKLKIRGVKAREILDSRGNPTLEVEIETKIGVSRASVPSGASKGKYEARELRDGGRRFHGMGVLKAIENIKKIIGPKLKGKDLTRQKEVDEFLISLDGTENKSRLGANTICGVSMAICRAGAGARGIPLYQYISQLLPHNKNSTIARNVLLAPFPCFNIINGGLHAGNELDFQEFMVVPRGRFFSENLRIGSEIYHQLKNITLKRYGKQAVNLGDEGGFAPPLKFPEEALRLILEVAKKVKYEKKIKIILDIASSRFFEISLIKSRKTSLLGKYSLGIGDFTKEELARYYSKLVSNYPILGLEDPFSEDDWEGWKKFNSKLKAKNSKLLVVGDDLLVTNPDRIKVAKEKDACNAVIIKINQIGTVSEAIEAVRLAKDFGWKIVVSHRSGETNDCFISDFAVGIRADFIKAGAPAKGERVAKYNRLLRIEEEIRSGSRF